MPYPRDQQDALNLRSPSVLRQPESESISRGNLACGATVSAPCGDAAAQIRALVSGFPGERGIWREMLMLQAYVDESGNGDPHLLVLAGYIARSEVWEAFSQEWKLQLLEARLKSFKMREMRNTPEIAGWFYRLIEKHQIQASVACIINTKELIEVERSIVYPSNLKPWDSINPYYWAFRNIIVILAENQKSIGLTEPVDFIFDDKSEKVKIPRAWDVMKNAPGAPDILGDAPIFRNDEKVMPLQAADLYAWWILKWQREGVANWAEDMPFPWGEKRKINRIIAYFGRKSFLAENSNMLLSIARNNQERQYAMSLMPEGWT